MTYDLVVAGAGPGGSAAAAVAAKAGLRVLLIERASFPRDKVCGDAISGKSVDVLSELGLTGHVAASETIDSWGVLFGSPSGAEVEIPFCGDRQAAEAPGYICRREVFDEIVARRAVELGAELREETVVEGLLLEGSSVRGVRLSGGQIARAPIVIGADGAYSAVARALGFSQLDERHYYAGVRAYFRGVEGFRGRNFLELHFLDESIPGYFWIFPMADGRANVGMGTLSSRIKREDVRLKPLLQSVMESTRFRDRFQRAERVGRIRGWGMPLGSAVRTMAGGGWMLVGDAASLIDPFTGEGIGNAMVSGSLSADWAVRAHERRDFSADCLQGYQRDVHRVLGGELRLSDTLRRMESWRWLLNTVIRKASTNPEVAAAISSMYDDLSARKQLTSPLFYLKLLAGRKPAA